MLDAPFWDQQVEIVCSKSIHIPSNTQMYVAKFAGVFGTSKYFLNTSAGYYWSAKAYLKAQRVVHRLLKYVFE